MILSALVLHNGILPRDLSILVPLEMFPNQDTLDIIEHELPEICQSLRMADISLEAIIHQWLTQCFWTILPPTQAVVLSMLCPRLFGPQAALLGALSILRHLRPSIVHALAQGTLRKLLTEQRCEGYHAADHIEWIMSRSSTIYITEDE